MCIVNLSPVIVQRANRNSESKRLPIPFHFFSIMEKMGWKYLEDIVWVKPEGSAINRNGGFFQHRKPVAYKVRKEHVKFLVDEIIGRSIIIHEDEDDCGTGPNAESLKTGNAGKRIACAVIGYSKENF